MTSERIILDLFTAEFKELDNNHHIVGVIVGEKNITILHDDENQKGSFKVADVPPVWSRKVGETAINLPVVFEYSQPFRAKAGAGDVAFKRPEDATKRLLVPVDAGGAIGTAASGSWGTLGWAIIFNGMPSLVSNWHVLCRLGNATPIGQRVFDRQEPFPGQEIASLSLFEPIGDVNNRWDIAFAQLDNERLASGLFRKCANNNRYPYPRYLEDAPSYADTYYKVGARTGCVEGRFLGWGNTRIKYHDGSTKTFLHQLMFTEMGAAGDSGSIIVNLRTNKVVGLLFAGSSHLDAGDEPPYGTVANPLFEYSFRYKGTRWVEEVGAELPEYETTTPGLTNDSVSVFSLPTPEHEVPTFRAYAPSPPTTTGRILERRGDWLKIEGTVGNVVRGGTHFWINTTSPWYFFE